MRLSNHPKPDFVVVNGRMFSVPPRLLELLRTPILRAGDGFYLDEIPGWAMDYPPPEVIRKIIHAMAGILGLPYRLELWEQDIPDDYPHVRIMVFRQKGRRSSPPVPGARISGKPFGQDRRRKTTKYGWETFQPGETRIYTGVTQASVHSSHKGWCETRMIVGRRIATSLWADGRVEVWRTR